MLLAQSFDYGQGAARQMPNTWQGNGPMMWGFGVNPQNAWLFGILSFISWAVFIFVLIAIARWFWIKGDKERKGR